MKPKTLFGCFVFLLCSAVVQAENELPDSTANTSGIHLSEEFSKHFVLPDAYVMNTFSFDVSYTVYANKTGRVTDLKYTSSITKRTSNDALRPDFSHTPQWLITRELSPAIINWLTANGNLLSQTVSEFDFEDSIQMEAQVYYSPILYAQSGDTLFCTGEIENENLCNGEQAGMFYQYYVRNRRNTPYYALVRRHKNNVTLRIHDSETGKLFNIVNYHIASANLVTKTGNQIYFGEDGKTIRIIQVWKDNQLQSAETYNSDNHVEARYEFQYITWYPKLKKKEVLYPNGSVKLRAEYEKDDVTVTAFNEDGSPAKYTPAKDVEKAIKGYFKKNFSVPAIGYEYSGINYFDLKITINCAIDENGTILLTGPSVQRADWSYNYQSKVIQSGQIDHVIMREYSPYYREFWQTLTEQSLQCTPAKINGTPVASKATIRLVHDFTPKYTAKTTPKPVPTMPDSILRLVDSIMHLPGDATQPPDSIIQQAANDEPLFIVVEQMPEFPGGKEALFRFLNENVKYPAVAVANGIQGRVLCQFVVEKDGTITDVVVVKSGGDPSIDKEAVRVLKSMPKWIPGKQKGQPVRVKYTVPVSFKL